MQKYHIQILIQISIKIRKVSLHFSFKQNFEGNYSLYNCLNYSSWRSISLHNPYKLFCTALSYSGKYSRPDSPLHRRCLECRIKKIMATFPMFKWSRRGSESLRRSQTNTAEGVKCDKYHKHGPAQDTMAVQVHYWNKCCRRCPHSFCSDATNGELESAQLPQNGTSRGDKSDLIKAFGVL